jgi:hypothetical protein
MSRRAEKIDPRASYRDFILVDFEGRSFSTATPDYINDPHIFPFRGAYTKEM